MPFDLANLLSLSIDISRFASIRDRERERDRRDRRECLRRLRLTFLDLRLFFLLAGITSIL